MSVFCFTSILKFFLTIYFVLHGTFVFVLLNADKFSRFLSRMCEYGFCSPALTKLLALQSSYTDGSSRMLIHYGVLPVRLLLFAVLFLLLILTEGNCKITVWLSGFMIHYYVCSWWFLNTMNNYTVFFLLPGKSTKRGELFFLNHHASFNNGLI
jgi:hypothetical protein